ncbi:MAG: S1C family serine protease [Acidiferrobacterales bacterium]
MVKLLLLATIVAGNLILPVVSHAGGINPEYCNSLRKLTVSVAVQMRKGVPLDSMIAWAESQEYRIEQYLDDPQAVLRPVVYYIYDFQVDTKTSPDQIGNLVLGKCRNGSYGNIPPKSVSKTQGQRQSGEQEKIAEGESYSMGTGWPIAEGLIVTNNHVISGRNDITLIRTDNSRISARILEVDIENDLALLQVDDIDALPPALMIAEKPAMLGTKVFTIGYPHPKIMGSQPKLTDGIVSALSGLLDDKRTYQITVALQSGNSGGPLINMQGKVIGVVTSKLSAVKVFRWTGDLPQNVNYAMKSDLLLDFIERLEERDLVLDEVKPAGDTLQNLAEAIKNSVLIVVAR